MKDNIETIKDKPKQKKMKCPICSGVGIYDESLDRFFCMDCGFDSDG